MSLLGEDKGFEAGMEKTFFLREVWGQKSMYVFDIREE